MADPLLKSTLNRKLLNKASRIAYMRAYFGTPKVRVRGPNGTKAVVRTRRAVDNAEKASQIAYNEQRERLLMGEEDIRPRIKKTFRKSPPKQKVIKSKVVSLKPKTDRKRKAFDPKLLFKKRK